MSRRIVAVVLLLAMFAGGCHVDTSPQIVRRFGPNQSSLLSDTEYSGQYKLWKAKLEKEGDLTPTGEAMADLHLIKGTPLGFTHSTSGEPVAVAGKQGFSLDAGGHYVWQMKADAGQIDHEKTKRTVYVTAAVVACVGLAVAGIALAL